MSKPLKPKRGTTAENNQYLGEAYEITLDTEKHTLRAHDGVTVGGYPLATQAEAVAAQTSANNAAKAASDAQQTADEAVNAAANAHAAAEQAMEAAQSVEVPVTSVNGQTGDVQVGTVRTVNGVMADEAGNVTLGKGVHLVDSWKDGADWYRVWSDGWLEQGGYQASGGGTMSMHLPFSDKQYFWSAQSELLEAARVGGYEVYGNHLDGQTIDLSYSFSNYAANLDGYHHPFYWYACGYGG